MIGRLNARSFPAESDYCHSLQDLDPKETFSIGGCRPSIGMPARRWETLDLVFMASEHFCKLALKGKRGEVSRHRCYADRRASSNSCSHWRLWFRQQPPKTPRAITCFRGCRFRGCQGRFTLHLEVPVKKLLCKRNLNYLLEMAGGCRGKTC